MATKQQVLAAVKKINPHIYMQHDDCGVCYQTDFFLPEDSEKIFCGSGEKVFCTSSYYPTGSKSEYWSHLLTEYIHCGMINLQ